MITEDRSMTILIILIMAERAAERIWVHVTHLDGKLTGARELMLKSIRKLLYGHQGIRHIISHLREPACFMGPHGCRLTCALEVHFWCQLRILARRQFGVVRPMCQSGGSYVCKTFLWLAIGLNTVQQTA